MAYAPYAWKDNASGGTPITAARLNAIEQGIYNAAASADQAGSASGLILYAPAPSGGDDTAALQALITQAQSALGRGTIVLSAGTYIANLLMGPSFIAPLIVGQGAGYTAIKGNVASSPVVKFRGGSAGESAGGLRDITLLPADGTTTGIAVVFSGCTTIKCKDVIISTGSGSRFAEGVRFWNEVGSDFTEFCVFEGGAISGTAQPVKYRTDNGVESFHGSGLMGHTLINSINGSNPVITIDTGIALPYNAPMEIDAFIGAGQWLIYNGNTTSGRSASFWGHISVEGNNSATTPYGTGTNKVLFQGGISHLGSNSMRLGNIYLCDKITYEGSTVTPMYKPMSWATACTSSTTTITMPVQGGASYLVNVNLLGANYHRAYTLLVWDSPYDSSGVITQLANPFNVDTPAWGAPSFGWNYGLTITNANYANNVSAYVGLTPFGGIITTQGMNQ